MNVIPNENANFDSEFFEFDDFGSISYSLITVLLAWTHKKVYINMTSINVKKRETGKLHRRCQTSDEKIKILDEVKKRKLSCRAIAEEFKIGKAQAVNVVKNETKLRGDFGNFQGKGSKHIKRENYRKFKLINDILYSWFKKFEASGIYVNESLLKEEAISIKQS